MGADFCQDVDLPVLILGIMNVGQRTHERKPETSPDDNGTLAKLVCDAPANVQ